MARTAKKPEKITKSKGKTILAKKSEVKSPQSSLVQNNSSTSKSKDVKNLRRERFRLLARVAEIESSLSGHSSRIERGNSIGNVQFLSIS